MSNPFKKQPLAAVRECKLINDWWAWRLEVDGQNIGFQGAASADYFAEHYRKLGYKVSYWKVRSPNTAPVEVSQA
jgi:hypothetical protein